MPDPLPGTASETAGTLPGGGGCAAPLAWAGRAEGRALAIPEEGWADRDLKQSLLKSPEVKRVGRGMRLFHPSMLSGHFGSVRGFWGRF